ncbi:hypothetical protein KBX71_25755 [Micromonospora sp. D93]|nr:hypothetical protein [Micromonospora sp. D93]MBQ1021265.1 hypothetical protein [Micromonospora sp. D93]
MPTVLDESALGLPTIYVSAGRRGLQLELAAADLVALTDARTAPLQTPLTTVVTSNAPWDTQGVTVALLNCYRSQQTSDLRGLVELV